MSSKLLTKYTRNATDAIGFAALAAGMIPKASGVTETMQQYTEIPGFEHIYIEGSFVLQIVAEPSTVRFLMEMVLAPGHPNYATPGANEHECFRRACLSFTGVRTLQWLHSGLLPATDASGETDLGHIDSFVWAGNRYVLEGDWGTMEIESSHMPQISLGISATGSVKSEGWETR